MIKSLQKHGNSHALVIGKALMEAAGIQADSPLQITISGNSLIVTPVHVGVGCERVTETIGRLRPRYGPMLERLAKLRSKFLSVDDVLAIHENTIAYEGGLAGIRDPGLLESAVFMPQQQFGGQYLHHGRVAMAAAYLFYLAQNHPFDDGNKCTAVRHIEEEARISFATGAAGSAS